MLVLGGTGSIGFYCVAWARFLGAARLDYFDTRDDPALAARLGATVITEFPDHDTDGYDLVIDAAADAQVLARGLRLLPPAATATASASTSVTTRSCRWGPPT